MNITQQIDQHIFQLNQQITRLRFLIDSEAAFLQSKVTALSQIQRAEICRHRSLQLNQLKILSQHLGLLKGLTHDPDLLLVKLELIDPVSFPADEV